MSLEEGRVDEVEIDGPLLLLLLAGVVCGCSHIPGVPHTSTLPNLANVAGSDVAMTSEPV